MKPKLGMVRPWSLLRKLQNVHKNDIGYFHGNRIIPSCVPMSHFPRWLGQSETSKKMKIIIPVLKKIEKSSLKITRIEKISEFGNTKMYLLMWEGA